MANALLKGHLMKRGTIMVLKRLLITTLGALGLAALTAGSASAQGLLKDPKDLTAPGAVAAFVALPAHAVIGPGG